MKSFSHLNRLSQAGSNQAVRFSHKAASPGSHCPMHTALAAAKRIEGLSTLVVGMAECGYYSRFVMDCPKGKAGELHYTYEMDSNEVVFGCRTGLIKAIRQMDKEGAKVILIIMTCIPALIGEDPRSIQEELEGQIKAKVLVFDASHFKRNGYQSGYYEVFSLLAEVLDKPKEDFNLEQVSVNLLGSPVGEELECLKNELLLNKIEINEFGMKMSLNSFPEIAKCRLSIVTSKKMLKLAQNLWKRLSIPYISLCSIYDADEIKEVYRAIFEKLQVSMTKEYEGYLEQQREQVFALEKQIEKVSYIMNHPELDSISLSSYLVSLEMKPILLHVEEMTEEDRKGREIILQKDLDPYVTYVSNQQLFNESADELQINLLLGNYSGDKDIKIINGRDINRISNLCGFQRNIILLQTIQRVMKGGE
jgi:nitrogenase molybdenum-iron protein alpha/beta subunit